MHLRLWRYAFRIVAPGALKAAALEKDRGANTGTVLGGHSLNFKNGGL
jgi:hypothetical protein